MSLKVESRKIGDFLKFEENNNYCRAVKTALSGQTLVCGQVCSSSAAGKKQVLVGTGNETHTYTMVAVPTSGTFKFRLWHSGGYWVETAAIAYNAANTVIAAACNAVLGTSAVACTGTAATTMALAFSGSGYAAKYQPIGSMDIQDSFPTLSFTVSRSVAAGVARNEVQTVDFGAAATGGTVKFGVHIPQTGIPPSGEWPVVWTDTAAWSATDATYLAAIQAVLDQVCGANGIVVTAKAATDTDLALVFTFSGTGFLGIAHPVLDIDTSALTSVTTSTWTRTTPGGAVGAQLTALADSIALEAIDASAADKTGLFLVRGPAIVDADELVYGGGDPTAVAASLLAIGIIVQSEAARKAIAV